MKYRHISVAGTMGIGKTTLVKIIADEFDLIPVFEQFSTNPFLPKFYLDMKRWAYHSQTFFLIEKIKLMLNLQRTNGQKPFVQDTPIYQDVFSYAKAQRVLQHMDKDEWKLYFKLYKFFESKIQKPDLIIYLTCSLNKIYDRINNRKREYETNIERRNLLNYLGILDKLNKDWIKKFDNNIRILTVNTDGFDYVNEKTKRKKLLKFLKNEIKKK